MMDFWPSDLDSVLMLIELKNAFSSICLIKMFKSSSGETWYYSTFNGLQTRLFFFGQTKNCEIGLADLKRLGGGKSANSSCRLGIWYA